MISFAFCLVYSIYQSLGSIIGPLTAYFDYPTSEASIMGVIFIFFGLFGAFLHARILDKHKRYWLQLNFIILSSTFGLIFMTSALWIGNLYLMYFGLGLFGFLLIPIVGVGYTFTAMNFLPISPAASCGIVHIANAAFSFLLASWAAMYVVSNAWYSLLILFGAGLVACVCGLLTWVNPNINIDK